MSRLLCVPGSGESSFSPKKASLKYRELNSRVNDVVNHNEIFYKSSDIS